MTEVASRILVRGGRVYDHDGDVHRPPVADVRIVDDRISELAPDLSPTPGERVLDARGKLVIPGLVNAHYHSHDVLAKGLLEGLPLEMWMFYSRMPDAWRRSDQEVRARTLLGAWECLRNGITTVQDMNNRLPLDEEYLDGVLAAYADIGIRVVYSTAIQDLGHADATPYWCELLPAEGSATAGGAMPDAGAQVEFVAAQIARRPGADSRLHWALGPSGPQRCSAKMLEAVADLAREHRLPVYTHVLETRAQALQGHLRYGEHGGSLVRYLADLGVLGPRTNLVHAVWLRPEEIDLIGETGSRVVHNPGSNLKLKSGIAPMLDIHRAGIGVALGCDNTTAGDTQNLFPVMRLHAYLAGASDPEPDGRWSGEAMRAATLGGAASAALEGEIGAIAPGMKADLVLLDLDDPAFQPLNSALRQLVYSESGRAVQTVIVDGRVVLEDGRLTTVDEDELRLELAEIGERFRRDHADLVAHCAPLRPGLEEAHRKAWQQEVGAERLVRR